MQAAVNVARGRFDIREVEAPVPAPDEALVRVRACAICGSDKHEFQGERPPRVAGHEIAGTIVGFGNSETGGLGEGDAVVVLPLIGCGACPACAAGRFGECPAGQGAVGYSRPGGFAEYVAVPTRNLLPMAPGLSFAKASLAEPAAVGIHAASQTDLTGKHCLTVGAGAIGLLTAQAALCRGAAAVWVADTDATKLEPAEALGLRPLHIGRDALPSQELEVAFECVGRHDAPLATALAALRDGGTLVLVGSGHPGGLNTTDLVARRLTVIGSCGVSVAEMQEAQEWMAAGRIQVQPLLSGTFPLSRFNAAFAASLTGQKVVIEP